MEPTKLNATLTQTTFSVTPTTNPKETSYQKLRPESMPVTRKDWRGRHPDRTRTTHGVHSLPLRAIQSLVDTPAFNLEADLEMRCWGQHCWPCFSPLFSTRAQNLDKAVGEDLSLLSQGLPSQFLMTVTSGHLCSSLEEIFNLSNCLRHEFPFINPCWLIFNELEKNPFHIAEVEMDQSDA